MSLEAHQWWQKPVFHQNLVLNIHTTLKFSRFIKKLCVDEELLHAFYTIKTRVL